MIAFTCVADVYSSGAGTPLIRTVVPASCETIFPVDGSTVPDTPVEGPSIVPLITTSSPGETAPLAQLAAFTTAFTTTGGAAAAPTVSVTEIICGLFAAPEAVTETA